MRADLAAEARHRLIADRADPADRRAVDERVDLRQRHRSPGHQGGGHGGGPAGFGGENRGVRRAFPQIGADAREAAAATDRHHDQIRCAAELLEHLGGDGALPGRGARIVEGRHHGRAGAGDIVDGGRGGRVVGVADRDELHEFAAVHADSVPLLLGRGGRHVDAAAHSHRLARESDSLRVVSGAGGHHTGGLLGIGQLHHEVVGAAQLVGAHGGEVLALEVDLGTGQRR